MLQCPSITDCTKYRPIDGARWRCKHDSVRNDVITPQETNNLAIVEAGKIVAPVERVLCMQGLRRTDAEGLAMQHHIKS